MHKLLVFVAGATALGFLFPSAFERYQKQMASEQRAESVATVPAVIEVATQPTPPSLSGRARIDADPDGHFRTAARINGRSVPVLVDTGATYVSISEATARQLGIRLAPEDYRYTAQTANGATAVALARLDRIQIGNVTVQDVDVMVSHGTSLPTTLLGMSFLSRLKRFEVQSDQLNLVQ